MPTSVNSVVRTLVECSKTFIRNTIKDAKSAKTLGERINTIWCTNSSVFVLRKHWTLLTGPTLPSEDDIAKFTRNRGWHDVARFDDKVSASLKPASTGETRRSALNTPVEDSNEALPHAGTGMFFFCNTPLTVCNISKVSHFLLTNIGPSFKSNSGSFLPTPFGRGVITTIKVKESEILCEYQNDVIITHSVLSRRENTQYTLDCVEIVLIAPSKRVLAIPDERPFGVYLIIDHPIMPSVTWENGNWLSTEKMWVFSLLNGESMHSRNFALIITIQNVEQNFNSRSFKDLHPLLHPPNLRPLCLPL